VGPVSATPVGGNLAAASAEADYYDRVGAWLHGQWRQPSRAEAGSGKPVVRVILRVAPDGRVLASRISAPSANPAMNRSVEELLAAVRELPAYRGTAIRATSLEIEVAFVLE
jgi:TonB family protein